MDLLNEKVEELEGRDTSNLIRLEGAYFHGFCDQHDDLVYLRGPIKPEVKDGVHDVTVYGKPAKLYYWTANNPHWPTGRRARGLVVLERTESELDAKAKFNRKQDGL